MTAALLRQPDVRRLFASRVVSELGTWLAYVALAVAVYDRTHSPSWVGVLLLLDSVPAILAGFVLGPLLDRADRRLVLVFGELGGAAAFTGLALSGSLAPLLVLAFLAGCAAALTSPGLNAALPKLVPHSDLAAVNGLMQSVQSGAILLGPPLAGVLVAFAGPASAFGLNAASFALSAVLLARIPGARFQTQDEREAANAEGAYGTSLLNGLRLFARGPLLTVLVSWSAACGAFGLVNVAEILIARRVFHTGDAGFGILAAASGAGMLVGSMTLGRLTRAGSSLGLYGAALAMAAVGLAGLAVAPWFPLGIACFALAAAGNAVALAARRLAVQHECAPAALGRAFGVLNACGLTTSVAGLAGAGLIVSVAGARGLVAVSAAVTAVGALVVAAAIAAPLRRPLPAKPVTRTA
jgi:predicted MFS family arabinose efflux permease